MTKAGEKWVEEHIKDELPEDGHVPPGIGMTILEVRCSQADFWLRALCDEVERRADQCRSTHDNQWPVQRVAYVGAAFEELKRELLGLGVKPSMQTDYAAYWNAYANKVGYRAAVTPLSDDEYKALYLDELKQLGPEKPWKILDYGCGPALLLPIIRELWPEAIYHGADISQEMLFYCRSQWHDKDFEKAEFYSTLEELPSRYDFLICHSVFTHIQIADAVILLRKLHSYLEPDGIASISILDEPLKEDANFQGCIERCDYNKNFFEGMLVQAGFSIEKTYRKHQMYFGVRKV